MSIEFTLADRENGKKNKNVHGMVICKVITCNINCCVLMNKNNEMKAE